MNDDFSHQDLDDGHLARGRSTPATKAGSDLPPVGDIQLKKKSGTYNTYTIQLSYGQIECIRQAVEKDHATPIADELRELLDYYLKTLPGPGEDDDDVKARDEMVDADSSEDGDDDDMLIPLPPGEDEDGGITVAGEGPEDDDLMIDEQPDAEDRRGAADARLPRPPAE